MSRRADMNKKGFTLIETVIGIVVIGIIALGLFSAFTGVFTNACRDEVLTVAVSLAKGEMERVAHLAFSAINSTPDTNFQGNFSNYSCQVIVSQVPFAPDTLQYKQVEVLVANSLVGDVSLKTIVTNR